jgi:hypothetical protein
MADDSASPVAHTKHGDLSLDQIAEQMPGMARLMVEISDRYWIMYYAAKGGAWDLARHEFGELRKTMQQAGVVRPKYAEPLAGFIAEKLKPLEAAIRAKDWAAFEAQFRDTADAANEMHVEFGYNYIVWQLPDEPPKHLRLQA